MRAGGRGKQLEATSAVPGSPDWPCQLASLIDLAAIPDEGVWRASQKSFRNRRAYKQDVTHLMRTLAITTLDHLRQVDHRAVIAWERIMREDERLADIARRHWSPPPPEGPHA